MTKSIRATSRISAKIKDNFFTVEFCEERTVPENINENDLQYERDRLWDTVNSEVDNQLQDIMKTFK